jgi:hypothetical protein
VRSAPPSSRRWAASNLFAATAEHASHHSGRGHADQQHVVEADFVEAVLERQHTLDLVGLDHGRQYVAHRQRRLARGDVAPRDIVRDREDGAQVVRGMAPLGGQPGVVEVQVADQHAEVEGRLRRLEFVCRAGHAGAARHVGAGDHRPQQAGAARKLHREHCAGETVNQAVTRGRIRLGAVDFIAADIVCDVDKHLVESGPFSRANAYLGHENLCCGMR